MKDSTLRRILIVQYLAIAIVYTLILIRNLRTAP